MSHQGRLPNLIVGGALKGGSTTLYHYLKQHPQIFMAERKELRYFAYDVNDPWCLENGSAFPIKTLDEYKAAFAPVTDEVAFGEASPNYLASQFAPQKIHETIPEVKLLFSLRDPVKSAYSSYMMDVRANREQRPVEEAFGFDERRVERYCYFNYLKNWYDVFKPEQIKVILFEDLIKRVEPTVHSIYSFVGVDTDFVPDLSQVDQNKGGVPKSALSAMMYRTIRTVRSSGVVKILRPFMPNSARKAYRNARDSNLTKAPELPQEIAQRLRDFYRDDILQLEKLTGLNCAHWLEN